MALAHPYFNDLPTNNLLTHPASRESSFGGLLVGYILMMAGFGFTFFQTYSYFTRAPRDGWVNKIFAGIVSALDIVITALASRYVYYEMITLYFGAEDLSGMIASSKAEYVLSAMVVFIAQLFYSYQVWLQSKQVLIALPMAVFSLVAFVLMIATSAKFFQNNAFLDLSETPTKELKLAGLALTFIVATMHGSLLGWAAWQRERLSALSGLGAVYDRLILCFIDPGALAALLQFGYLVAFGTSPEQPLWLPFHLITTKLFVNGCLSFLTSTGVEGSLVTESGERFSSKNQQLSRISAVPPFTTSILARSPPGKSGFESFHNIKVDEEETEFRQNDDDDDKVGMGGLAPLRL